MDNDQPKQTVEEVIRSIPSTSKEGDKISRRKIAEVLARLIYGEEVSEEQVQKMVNYMDWQDANPWVTPGEKRNRIIAWVSIFVSMVCLAISFFPFEYAGFLFWISLVVMSSATMFFVVVEGLRIRRLDNRSPPPQL